jgi:hypothetical protein
MATPEKVRKHTDRARIDAYSAGWNWPYQRCVMKWAGMYFVGFTILIGGVLAALWKLGVLQHIETTWIVIGVAILMGMGIMFAVANSGTKENIQIDRK